MVHREHRVRDWQHSLGSRAVRKPEAAVRLHMRKRYRVDGRRHALGREDKI